MTEFISLQLGMLEWGLHPPLLSWVTLAPPLKSIDTASVVLKFIDKV